MQQILVKYQDTQTHTVDMSASLVLDEWKQAMKQIVAILEPQMCEHHILSSSTKTVRVEGHRVHT